MCWILGLCLAVGSSNLSNLWVVREDLIELKGWTKCVPEGWSNSRNTGVFNCDGGGGLGWDLILVLEFIPLYGIILFQQCQCRYQSQGDFSLGLSFTSRAVATRRDESVMQQDAQNAMHDISQDVLTYSRAVQRNVYPCVYLKMLSFHGKEGNNKHFRWLKEKLSKKYPNRSLFIWSSRGHDTRTLHRHRNNYLQPCR